MTGLRRLLLEQLMSSFDDDGSELSELVSLGERFGLLTAEELASWRGRARRLGDDTELPTLDPAARERVRAANERLDPHIAEVLEHALRELGVPDADADAWSVIDRVVAGPATRAAGARVLFAVLRRPSLELAFDLEPTARARLSRVLESEPDPHAAFSLEDDAGTLYHPAGARTHGAAATLSWTPAPPPRA
ncbi:MAG: hypothetical protein ACR2NB_13885, partial [Solirubrobacteraceae bacterium]